MTPEELQLICEKIERVASSLQRLERLLKSWNDDPLFKKDKHGNLVVSIEDSHRRGQHETNNK
jgi:hypothetical protein